MTKHPLMMNRIYHILGIHIKRCVTMIVLAMAFLCSCSTDVDLYTSPTDATIVYGVLDVAADTNFIKITRAFPGCNDDGFDANQIMTIADSSNYPYKLDACLVEYSGPLHGNCTPTGREIRLDTVTIHNKVNGMFYGPDQLMYFTKSRLYPNKKDKQYQYELRICKDDTITSRIGLLGSENFKVNTNMVFFSVTPSSLVRKVEMTLDEHDAVYQIDMQFNYKEVVPGHDTVYQNVQWTLGTFNKNDFYYDNGIYYVKYSERTLFDLLENTIEVSVLHVDRFFDSFLITVTAYGMDAYCYSQMSIPSGGLNHIAMDYNYTNIHGGYGVLSSKYKLVKNVAISPRAQADLLSKPWGFKQFGY